MKKKVFQGFIFGSLSSLNSTSSKPAQLEIGCVSNTLEIYLSHIFIYSLMPPLLCLQLYYIPTNYYISQQYSLGIYYVQQF